MITITQSSDTNQSNQQNQSNILEPVFLDNIEHDPKSHTVTFQHPEHDIAFSHAFIASEIQKIGLVYDGCIQCSQLAKHFIDPRSYLDKLAEEKIVWVKYSESCLRNLFPDLKKPIFDPVNINVKQPYDRPRGFIRVSHIAKHITDSGEFLKMAKGATASIL